MKRLKSKLQGARMFMGVLLLALVCPCCVFAGKIEPAYIMGMQKLLPPDPGPRGNATISGIDSNQNGVRDDVEIWIASKFADKPKARAVSLQLAAAMQKFMTSGENIDETTALNMKKQIRDGLECLFATGSEDVQATIFKELLNVIVNTPERSALIATLEQKYPEPEGLVISDPSVTACAIQPEALSN